MIILSFLDIVLIDLYCYKPLEMTEKAYIKIYIASPHSGSEVVMKISSDITIFDPFLLGLKVKLGCKYAF